MGVLQLCLWKFCFVAIECKIHGLKVLKKYKTMANTQFMQLVTQTLGFMAYFHIFCLLVLIFMWLIICFQLQITKFYLKLIRYSMNCAYREVLEETKRLEYSAYCQFIKDLTKGFHFIVNDLNSDVIIVIIWLILIIL